MLSSSCVDDFVILECDTRIKHIPVPPCHRSLMCTKSFHRGACNKRRKPHKNELHKRAIVTIDEQNKLWDGVLTVEGDHIFAVYDGNPDNCEKISHTDACDDIRIFEMLYTG